MMAKTLRQLIDNSSARCDVTNKSDAQWAVWVNDGRVRMRDLLAASDQAYFVTTDISTVTVVDQEEYSLPADFLRLLELDIQDGQGRWRAVQPYRHGDRNALRNVDDPFVTVYSEYKYALSGTSLSILPAPTVAGNVIRIRYMPVPTALSDPDNDSLSGIEEYFSEFIEIWAALQARISVEEDTLPLERLLTRAQDRIRSAAPQRDSNHPRVLGSMVPYTPGKRRWWP